MTGTEPPIDVRAYGHLLAQRVTDAFPDWTVAIVAERAGHAHEVDARRLGVALAGRIAGPLAQLLDTDIDAQRESPLALVRQHLAPLTEFLRGVGAEPAQRDPYDRDAFPDDEYGLYPTSWSDFGEEVSDAGLRWGAAKAMAHRRRHQPS